MLLAGIKVLDLTRLLPGAYCSMLMADVGAEVLKVEEPGRGDYFRWMEPRSGGQSIYFQCVNRNKRSMTLNLKSGKGKAILLSLARKSDVLLESFRPGVMGRLGFDYDSVRRENPGIVYASISGYGQDGPYRNRAGHDGNYLGLAGILHMTGEPGRRPVHPAVPLGDLAVGGILTAFAASAALARRSQTGEGQYIDISMLDGLASLLTVYAAEYFHDGREHRRGLNHFAGGSVANTVYETLDGRYLVLSVIEEKFWRNFCRAIGRTDLEGGDFLSVRHASPLGEEVQKTIRTKTMAEWVAALEGKETCCEPVNTPGEALENDHLRSRGMVIDIPHPALGTVHQVGNPVKAPGATRDRHLPPPGMGEHTREVLRGEGCSDAEIDRFREEGVI